VTNLRRLTVLGGAVGPPVLCVTAGGAASVVQAWHGDARARTVIEVRKVTGMHPECAARSALVSYPDG
jgi:hypothetical protein